MCIANIIQKQEKGKKKDKKEKKYAVLPGGESNPGLPRDRRGYSPLYYRGWDEMIVETFVTQRSNHIPNKPLAKKTACSHL